LYRLYVAPFIRVNNEKTTSDGATLDITIENTGFLRSSIMTASIDGEDPFTERTYSYGLIEVRISDPSGFSVVGNNPVNIGWLGGGRADDPAPRIKFAGFAISRLSRGDTFTVSAVSEKTGEVRADIEVVGKKKGSYQFKILATNEVQRSSQVDAYFLGKGPDYVKNAGALTRTINQVRQDIEQAEQKRKQWKRIEGPFDVLPGHVKGITVKKYH
jgi:hypothetical protein